MNSKLCTCKARTAAAVEGQGGRDGWVSSRARTQSPSPEQPPKHKCWGVSELTSSNVFMSRLLPASWLLCGRCRVGERQPPAKTSPLEDLASCQLRGLPFLPGPDLLPRGRVGGCVSARRPRAHLPDEFHSMFCNLQVFSFPISTSCRHFPSVHGGYVKKS